MKKAVILVLLTLFLCGCTTTPDPAEKGLSMQDAIVIEASNEDMGVPMEYDWLSANGCPDNGGVIEVERQELLGDDSSGWFDALYVICSDETKKTYYFNIDSFFGKWE